MKVKIILISLIFITFLIIECNGFKDLEGNEYQNNIISIFSNLYQKELQSVVQIEVFTNEQEKNKQGSGVIISKDGYIITNNHVVEDAKRIVILMNNLEDYNATLIGIDPKTDIALLKINSDNNFIAAKIGNSDNIKVGEWVAAIGSPFGLQNSITAGIISGKDRQFSEFYSNFIQIDAVINPGNSGSPLFNLKGEVIGINTIIMTKNGVNSNVGFAVSINAAMFVVNELKTKGEVIRGWIGVIVQSIDSEVKKRYKLKSRRGAFVKEVSKNSPADKAGLKVKDVIIEFNHKKIKYMHRLIYIISISPIGKRLEIIVLRKNEKKKLNVILEKLDPNNVISVSDLHKKFGYDITVVDEDIANKIYKKSKSKIEELIGRIIVTEVVLESSAYLSGLRKDDLIITINTKPIKLAEDYTIAMLKLSLNKPFLMTVLRNADIKYLVLFIKAGDLL